MNGAVASLALVAAAVAQDSRPASRPSSAPAASNASRAVDLGLAYLRRQQSEPDGSFSPASVPRDRHAPVAFAAIAALAYMADGNTETRGAYAPELRRSVDYLLSKAAFLGPAGEPEQAYFHAEGDELSRMHGHGYATLALAQLTGMADPAAGPAREERIRRVLSAAVRLIEASQGDEGGWTYVPRRDADHEGSVTIALVQALRAARDAGIAVSSTTIRRAIDYVRRSQRPSDGAFRYKLDSPRASSALTAAAIATLNATGDYDSDAVDRGMRYLLAAIEKRRDSGSSRAEDPYPGYELLYTAQALRQHRDPSVFAKWIEQERPRWLERQQPDGSWSDPYGPVFGTAVHCIVLRTEGSYLPILQR
ncbi:MAG TPA: prenyltransferase/squalene oxidase repeat-containing protein [Planctomycetota bacterium]|nr:prenyltransferase/squalene oxidase repeat-containing protein [Planctomycetota bacterium]